MFAYGAGVEKSFQDAALWMRSAAEQGHADAQYEFIHLSHKIPYPGRSDKENREIVAMWLTETANKGHHGARFSLAQMYLDGQGVEQSFTDYFTWMKRAAEQGYVEAQYHLGRGFFLGIAGQRQSFANAAIWIKRAAEQGHADAQYYIASMYSDGQGVEQSHTDYLTWITKAAVQGHPDAQREFRTIITNGTESSIFENIPKCVNSDTFLK